MGAALALISSRSTLGLAIVLASCLARPTVGAQSPAPAPAPVAKIEALPKLPPRSPIAGIHVLEATSTVIPLGKPGVDQELIVTFAFPARVRMQESTNAANASERTFRYRYGETLFQYDLKKDKASSEITGSARTATLGEMELRRALLLWPDGFDWKSDGESRTTSSADAGKIAAHVATASKQPDRLASLEESGTERLSFRSIQWSESGGRAWPTRFEVWRSGTHVADETIVSHDITKSYVDLFFAPADRRDRATERDAMMGVVSEQELPRFCARRVELTTKSSWPEARREIESILADWAARMKERSLALDPGWTVEIDEAARPKAVLVRLASIPESVPEGFTTTVMRQARVMFVRGLTEATVARLDELRGAVPSGAATQPAYLRFRPDSGPVLIVLPLAP